MIMINSTRQHPAQSFTLFPRLPVELQRLIWELCLPARIVELDLQGTDMLPTPTSCSLQPTSRINSRAPLVTRICRESRNVALLAGAKELYDNGGDDDDNGRPEWVAMNDIHDLWVTPSTDVLHLNFYNAYDYWYFTSGNPLRVLVWLARRNHYHPRMSIVAELVMGFDNLEGSEFMGRFQENFDVLSEAGGPYLTTLCVVSLHVGLDAALHTEGGMLFGRLGEERVKLVEAGDRAALQAYCDLWTAGPAEDREPAPFFDLAVRKHESEWLPRVAQWRQRVVTAWVSHCLAKARTETDHAGVQDPQGVWRAPGKDEWRLVLKGDSGPFPDYMRPGPSYGGRTTPRVPNKEHPWVAEVLRDMPCFEPVVMFRLCEDKCYAPKPPSPRLSRGRGGCTRVARRGMVDFLHYLARCP